MLYYLILGVLEGWAAFYHLKLGVHKLHSQIKFTLGRERKSSHFS